VTLDRAFWTKFRRRYWERRGLVLQRPLAKPDEAFRWLVEAGERFRAGDRSVAPEFFVEHTQVLADVARYVPRTRDRSMAGYADRVTRRLDGRRFGLVIDDFQAQAPELWLRLRDFLRPLYAVTGLPGSHVKATLFLGNYRSTPFGLHRGRSGNFMFVVHGRKHIRAWPDRFFRGKEDLTNRLDYGRYNRSSILMSANPGDVIYWPSDYWHIGEDAGGLSVAISVALFMEPDLAADLARHVETALETRLNGQRRHVAALRELRAVGRSRELEQSLGAAHLNHLTGYGFARVPAPLPTCRLKATTVVRGSSADPIRLLSSADAELVCSANGHAFAVTARGRIPDLLDRLNSGEPARVGDLIADYSGRPVSRASIRAVLEKLHSLRALSSQ
jgi:hypothetical protein